MGNNFFNKLTKIYLALCWAFFIFKPLTLPVYGEEELSFGQLDKIIHLLLFLILTYLFLRVFFAYKFKIIAGSALALFISSAYGFWLEYLQNFIPGRFSSIFDFSAAFLGSVLALSLYCFRARRPRLLLQICCAGCGAYVSQILKPKFRVSLYFYNPNIFSREEFKKRKKEIEKIAKRYKLNLISEEYNHEAWLKKIKGHENDREKGERCAICYYHRLKAAAQAAKRRGYKYFATSLTISPHKDAGKISALGNKLALDYGLRFLGQDFKKQDGFKKSVCLSQEIGIYRQAYCGCEFSYRAKV